MDYTCNYIEEAIQILRKLDQKKIERVVSFLTDVQGGGGRLFFLGVGGGAGHASHAVNDFRKIAGIECYTPTDNVSELTARIHDEGWDGSYAAWLEGSRLSGKDAIFVFSVGGGSIEKQVSMNIVK